MDSSEIVCKKKILERVNEVQDRIRHNVNIGIKVGQRWQNKDNNRTIKIIRIWIDESTGNPWITGVQENFPDLGNIFYHIETMFAFWDLIEDV